MAMGGYRQGSGRSKSGYYKGIYCGSTYELCWVIHSIDHGVEFSRFPGKLELNGITYYPDFLLADNKTIIETKGYEKQESVQRKTDVAKSYGYDVCVFRKEDLKFAFDYVSNTYGTSKYYELYDGYKPKFDYNCVYCSSLFSTDKKKKTENYFCSRVCAGKSRASKTFVMPDDIKKKISQSLVGKKMQPYKRKHIQIWITDGKTDTRIKKDDIIPKGFVQGRSHRER
jgi:hypothetical protein